MSLPSLEVLFGGAAGGGKSDFLLMAAAQFVHVKGYSAILLRQSFADLNQPDGLIPRSLAWWGGKAEWSAQKHEWTFPSGAVIKFGYLDKSEDVYQYQGAAFQFVGWDELTQFRESDYRYLFSRLRKPLAMNVPLRVRAASNPGGRGHGWVKRRFLDQGRRMGRVFVPAKLLDNPHIDVATYRRSLRELDPITRQQLESGDWNVRSAGGLFKREWFEIVEQAPAELTEWVRYWDLAATEKDDTAKKKKGKDPDFTAGALIGCHNGVWYCADLAAFQKDPADVEARIKQKAQTDPDGTRIGMEQEGGASGKSLVSHYSRNVLVGYSFEGIPSLVDKVQRARPFSAAAKNKNFKLVEGDWNSRFLDEVEAFPEGENDDVIDTVSGGMNMIQSGYRILVA